MSNLEVVSETEALAGKILTDVQLWTEQVDEELELEPKNWDLTEIIDDGKTIIDEVNELKDTEITESTKEMLDNVSDILEAKVKNLEQKQSTVTLGKGIARDIIGILRSET